MVPSAPEGGEGLDGGEGQHDERDHERRHAAELETDERDDPDDHAARHGDGHVALGRLVTERRRGGTRPGRRATGRGGRRHGASGSGLLGGGGHRPDAHVGIAATREIPVGPGRSSAGVGAPRDRRRRHRLERGHDASAPTAPGSSSATTASPLTSATTTRSGSTAISGARLRPPRWPPSPVRPSCRRGSPRAGRPPLRGRESPRHRGGRTPTGAARSTPRRRARSRSRTVVAQDRGLELALVGVPVRPLLTPGGCGYRRPGVRVLTLLAPQHRGDLARRGVRPVRQRRGPRSGSRPRRATRCGPAPRTGVRRLVAALDRRLGPDDPHAGNLLFGPGLVRCRRRPLSRSDLEELLLLVGEQPVDGRHVVLGDLVQVLLHPLELVGGECRRPSAAPRAPGGPPRRMFRTATRPSSAFCLTTLTSSLRRCSVGMRERQADDRAVVGRGDPQVGALDAPSRWPPASSCRRGRPPAAWPRGR